jgi:hypothetical protein
MELLVLVIGLIALGLLALRYGYDSRDGFGGVEHGIGAFKSPYSDPAYDLELSREIQQSRRRYAGRGKIVDTRSQQADRELEQAA